MNIDEAKRVYDSCVYCLEFPNGRKYVGKTKNLSDRMELYLRFDGANKELSSAIEEFGWDSINIGVLSRVDCKDRVDLDLCLGVLEIRYIRELNTLTPNGYNVSLGGECLGIPIEYLTTDKDAIKRFNDGSRAVLLYDERGDFVKEYPSIARCAYDNGWDEDSVRGAIGKSKPYRDKFFIRFKRYDYIPNKIELPKCYEVCEKVRIKYKNVIEEVKIEKEREVFTFTPALRYDMNGKFCGEYASKREALRSFSKSHHVDWGQYHNGYIIYKKKDDNYPMQIESYVEFANKQIGDYYVPANELPDVEIHEDWSKVANIANNNKAQLCVDGKYTNIKHQFKVYQYKLNGELVAQFDSIRDASHETGIAYSQIYNCLNGRTKKAAGYLWKSEQN